VASAVVASVVALVVAEAAIPVLVPADHIIPHMEDQVMVDPSVTGAVAMALTELQECTLQTSFQ
jgi:hypothetical protein